MKELKFLVLAFTLFAMVPSVSVSASGNPYVGGYFNSSQATATKAYMAMDFSGTTPSVIPSSAWLGGVASILGQSTTGNCPCTYQSGFLLWHNGTVDYAPQTHKSNGGLLSGAEVHVFGGYTDVALNGIIRYNSATSKVNFTGFDYSDNTEYINNAPTIYNIYSVNTGDTNFYTGYSTVTIGGTQYTLKRFQFGVESTANITSSSWHVNDYQIEAYTTSWVYQSALSTECCSTSGSLIAVVGTTGLWVGTSATKGVNLYSSRTSSDSEGWWYTGTDIGNGASIWSGSGGGTPYSCQVSGRC